MILLNKEHAVGGGKKKVMGVNLESQKVTYLIYGLS